MKAMLPRAAVLLGLSLGSVLGGCVHITNTYTGLPGDAYAHNQTQQGTQTVAGRDCGCPGTTSGGYPYPVHYPQPYYYPSSDHYYYYPSYGHPYYGGYYPRPEEHKGEEGTGGSAIGGTVGGGPVASTPRRPDESHEQPRDPRVGDAGPSVGINPNLGGVSTPRDPRADDPHSGDVRPNIPAEGAVREATPVSDAPETDTRPRTPAPVATNDPRASAPHDVTVRPATEGEGRGSAPRRDSRPASGADAGDQARPNPDRGTTPVRTGAEESPKATTPERGGRDVISPAAGPSVSQPRRESERAATTAPVDAGASARTGTVDRAWETTAPAAGSGARSENMTREKENAGGRSDERKGDAAPPAATGSQRRSGRGAGEGRERAANPAASGSASRPAETSAGKSAGADAAAVPASRSRAGRSDGLNLDGVTPTVAAPAGSAGANVRSGTP